MRRWRRLGAQPIFVNFCGGFAIFAVIAALVVLTTGKADGGITTRLEIAGGLLAMAAFAFGLNRMGLYISDKAVRRRYFYFQRTVPWTDVVAVGTESEKPAQFAKVEQICLELRNGKILATGIYFRNSNPINVFLPGDAPDGLAQKITSLISARRGHDVLMTLRTAHLKANRTN